MFIVISYILLVAYLYIKFVNFYDKHHRQQATDGARTYSAPPACTVHAYDSKLIMQDIIILKNNTGDCTFIE